MTTRKKCIELAKKIAKIRDNYTCQKCNATQDNTQIHGAHIIPVSAGGMIVCDPDNIMALCAGCHSTKCDSWHEAPLEQTWFFDKFPERYNRLKEKYETRPIKKFEWEEIHEKLKEQLKQLEG